MRWRSDPNESELRRTGRAVLMFLLPLLGLYCLVIGMDKGVGFAPAYAQEGTTGPPTTHRPTTTTEEPTTTTNPQSTGTFPETTEGPSTTFMPSTTTTRPGPPSTTYMIPGLTTVPRGGGGGGPGPTSADCHTPPGVTEVTWKCNGSTWICHDKVSTPGTYCIDP